MTTYREAAAEAATFTKTAATVPTLTVDDTTYDNTTILDAEGTAVAVIFPEGGHYYAETATTSRECVTLADAVFFTAAVLTGEWAYVSDGAVASPLKGAY